MDIVILVLWLIIIIAGLISSMLDWDTVSQIILLSSNIIGFILFLSRKLWSKKAKEFWKEEVEKPLNE